MATNNAINISLNSTTGTGEFVGDTVSAFAGPTIGNATVTDYLTLIGTLGTTNADNASSGYVGEFITSNITFASKINCGATTIVTNLTSISLGAGDWDVWGSVLFITNTTTTTQAVSGISLTSGAFSYDDAYSSFGGFTTTSNLSTTLVPLIINISSPATVYLVTQIYYTGGTPTMCGYINARRRR